MRRARYQPYQRPPEHRRPPCDGAWKLLGCALIGAGMLLLLLCIPGWAWAAIAGAALVCCGWALINTCRR